MKWERSDLQEVIFALADQQPALRVVPVLNLLRRDMMADKPDGARGRDDKDLHDGPDTPSQGGRSGGTIARQVAIGRGACRERVCQYGEISGVGVDIKKKNK